MFNLLLSLSSFVFIIYLVQILLSSITNPSFNELIPEKDVIYEKDVDVEFVCSWLKENGLGHMQDKFKTDYTNKDSGQNFLCEGLNCGSKLVSYYANESIKVRGYSWNTYRENGKSFHDYMQYRQKETNDSLPILHSEFLKALHAGRVVEKVQEYNQPLLAGSYGSYFLTNKFKLKHDIQQLTYLLEKGSIPTNKESLFLLEELKTTYSHMYKPEDHLSEIKMFSLEEYQAIGSFFNKNFYIAPIPRLAFAINPNLDFEALQYKYISGHPEVLYVDNFLTQEALNSLYEFCLQSTIFNDVRESYLGTYFRTGFHGALLVQIAEELNSRFPKIFKGHGLRTAWAYKYENSMKGIKVHADDSAVNVNFWIAPDEANLDPTSGGLTVYPVEAPMHWDFDEYNREDKVPELVKFITESKVKPISVPHRRNRMVMFNGNLFHASDHNGNFEPENYKNRRINVTFLFGQRQPMKNK